ncbi:hypothetical protein O3M35_008268 [Rhynocoris fuscipes]|uniref:Androgen-dependent TFPI-regulating protein n=1 Tax=Rhynocoris fuscipes TaxID=488301 RepID=A0AAW1D8F9_9HEMI
MRTVGTVLFHVSALTFYLYIWKCQVTQIGLTYTTSEEEVVIVRKYFLRYLTKWSFAVQTIYFSMCVVQHFLNMISANKLRDKLIRYSDYWFTSIATPIALMISFVFWPIFIYDRQLILPIELDKIVPPWLNHSLHTLNAVLAIMDIILIKHRFPTWTKAINGMACYLTIYGICLFGTYFQSGVWLYPILGLLNWPQRILFSVISISLAIVMHGLMKLLHTIVWGK